MAGPENVPSVLVDGIRYEAIHWGKQRDLGQNGGFIAAIDAETGAELWISQIYEIIYGDKSPQKYDLFIRSISIADEGKALRIIDESGRVFRLRLADRDVLLVAEPVSEPAKPNPAKPSKPPRASD